MTVPPQDSFQLLTVKAANTGVARTIERVQLQRRTPYLVSVFMLAPSSLFPQKGARAICGTCPHID